MPFTTMDYIAFFAILFFTYYSVPSRWQWGILLVGSIVFYGWLSPWYLLFLGFTVVVSYVTALGMDASHRREREWINANGKAVGRDGKKAYKAQMERRRSCIGALTILSLLLLLGVFKYLEFVLANVAWLGGAIGMHWHPPSISLILPIGLSFYMFQSIAYLIDVQRVEVPAERDFFKHALFVSYFPQIMQGPIGNYGRLAPQLFAQHRFDYNEAVFGIQRVAWGFFKKVMVANIIADRISPVWGSVGDYPGFVCWAAVLFLYAIQLYADFSGYMDIACGCSQMLGIRLDENFNCPYFSRSVSEFWRRWHMTLSSWFKDYLFYPVLRSGWNARIRKCFADKYLASVIPTAVALAIVWAATGLWHGASWGYVVWGVYYGVFMILGIVLSPLYARFHASHPKWSETRCHVVFQMLRTFAIVLFGYSIFKPADLGTTVHIWKQMFSAIDGGGIYQLKYALHHSFIPVFGWMALMFAVDVVHYVKPKGTIRAWIRRFPMPVRWGIYLAGLWLMIFFGLYGSGFDQFEYFKF